MKGLWQSPTLRSAVVYALSGLGFAGANLILARVLPTEQYALFTLLIALINLGYSLAPMGVDGIVNRHHLEAGPALLRSALRPGLAIGLLFAATALAVYRTTPALAALLFVACVAGGAMTVAGAKFQSEQRFGASLALLQSPNLVLLLAALVTVAAHLPSAWPAILISSAGFVVAAIVGWVMLLAERHGKPQRGSAFRWGEALSFAGLNASGLVLLQLERLSLPHLRPLADLALYGVLGSIAGSLFRMLQMGVGFSLLPRLRAAPTVVDRRRLIAHELRLVGGIAAVGSVVIWFVTPLVEQWLLAGKYHLAGALVLAAIVSGIGKIANAFTKALASALAEPRELALVNVFGWVSVAISVAGAFVGARWGLAGLIYGVAIGWFMRSVFATVIILRHLRLPVSIPATAP